MKRVVVAVIVASVLLIAPHLFAEEYVNIKIPERTVIPIKLIQHLKGDQVSLGQNIDFEVCRDIIIDNYIVIKRGAPAYGIIIDCKKASHVSQGGKIGFSIDYCKAIDGARVHLKSILRSDAADHMGANIAASVILCPLILVAKGDEAEVPIGSEFRAYVENDVTVKVLKSNRLSSEEINLLEQKELEERKRIEKEKEEKKKQDEEKKREEMHGI